MNGFWGYVFSFEKLITVRVTRLIYIVGLVVGVLSGVVGFVNGLSMMNYNAAMGLGTAMLSLIGMLAGLLFWRLLCEFGIVVFGIYDRLGDIREQLKPEGAKAS